MARYYNVVGSHAWFDFLDEAPLLSVNTQTLGEAGTKVSKAVPISQRKHAVAPALNMK